MNNRTLKDFYYGNLTPASRQLVRGSEMERLVKESSELEDILGRAVPTDLLPTLERLIEVQAEYNHLIAETCYIDGFKAGARFVMEILDDTRENLKPITE